MTEKLVRAVVKGLVFALVCSLVVSVVVASLLYFEVIGISLASKILYGAFVVVLFISSFVIARQFGSRGLFVGFGIGCMIVLIGVLYRFIGIESGVGLSFLIRSAVTLLVATTGAVMGVNTVK